MGLGLSKMPDDNITLQNAIEMSKQEFAAEEDAKIMGLFNMPKIETTKAK
jgi:hypothetical protein